jgi:hypothetical protein
MKDEIIHRTLSQNVDGRFNCRCLPSVTQDGRQSPVWILLHSFRLPQVAIRYTMYLWRPDHHDKQRFAAFQSPFHPAYLKFYLSTIGTSPLAPLAWCTKLFTSRRPTRAPIYLNPVNKENAASRRACRSRRPAKGWQREDT